MVLEGVRKYSILIIHVIRATIIGLEDAKGPYDLQNIISLLSKVHSSD